MRLKCLILAGLLACAGCGDDSSGEYKNCDLDPIPLAGNAAAPKLVSAILECQGSLINVLATVEDPQGGSDLSNVVQRISVFEETSCTSTPRDVFDDFSGSGVEESFGIVVDQTVDPELFEDICLSQRWPIEVMIADKSGNTTSGRVLATVIQ